MTNDFKVMKWLRDVRDRNAIEEKGMSAQDRLARNREGSRRNLDAMCKDPNNSVHPAGERRVAKSGF
jgi:hypothetical protein